jgi:hypothetical protein
MTPHVDRRKGKPVGTYVLDRTFPGVGRIKRASGTSQKGVFGRINRMLTALADEGRLDLLRGVRDGRLAPLAVLDAYTRKDLHSLPTADTARTLIQAWEAWETKLRVPEDCSAGHKVMTGVARRHLAGVKPGAMLADLPELVATLRDTLGRKHPRAFTYVRSRALAFVRDTLRRSHPLYREVQAVDPLKKRTTVRRTPPHA